MNGPARYFGVALVCLLALIAGASEPRSAPPQDPGAARASWRGVHIMVPGRTGLPLLERAIAERLAPLGVNTLLLEVNYRFQFRSHPELSSADGLTRDDARSLAAFCKERGVRVIPIFNCLGHQSWAQQTFALLKQHPEFDETPQAPADNKGLYCRSWCPLHPQVNEIVFALMDELIEAFQANALHVGMDEVFLVASDQCGRCKGKDPAALFAQAVNDYHRHLVTEKKVDMLMWGDRLLDSSKMSYGKWEASDNGTAGAIDHIPKDIILCDWHYEPRESYPSVPFFQEKGFRVWPASWRNKEAALALLDYSHKHATDKLVGHLCTTWSDSNAICRALLDEAEAAKGRTQGARQIADSITACMTALKSWRQAPGSGAPKP